MRTKFAAIIFILILLNAITAFSAPENNAKFLNAYCGSAVLTGALENLGVSADGQAAVIRQLNKSADCRKGLNSLYEIKKAAAALGLNTVAVKIGVQSLPEFLSKGRIIANITGNRHFCLIEDADSQKVSVYVPGIHYEHPQMLYAQFTEYWDGTALIVSRNDINLKGIKAEYALVKDNELKNIFGGQSCSNVSGGSGKYTGSGGSGRWSEGNGSGKKRDPSTTEPVVIRNGNLFLEVSDVSVPTRSFPLGISRYYNSQVTSEVSGWLPEPGAGSWSIENAEYSGQGNRSTTDLVVADFTLDLDMQTIQPGGNYAWETAWVNFRYTENPSDPRKAQDCYYFLMHTNGYVELSKWKNNVQYFLVNKPTSYRPVNKNHIKIIASGSNIKIYVNGILQIDYTDSNPVLAAGRIALESYFSHSHFDNVVISGGSQSFTYDFANDDNEFPFGRGWTYSYSLRVKEYPNHITLYRQNNAKEIYVPNADGTYFCAPVNLYSKLTKDASGFSLKEKNGLHYRFDLSGRLQYIEDRNLNRTNLAYSVINGKTLLAEITEPAGRKITLQYGANNLVSRVVTPAGNYAQYFYDAAGNLTRVTDLNGNNTDYAYDAVTGNLLTLTDPQGNIYNYTYTYNDRVSNQTDPLGNVTTFDFLWSTTHVINKRNEIYKYNFDTNGFLQSVTDPANKMSRSTNDANGNVTSLYDKKGAHTDFTYDSSGNRTGIYDRQSKWTRFTYEPVFNLPASVTDANGSVTNFSYDAKGNLTQSVDAEAAAITYTYNSFGLPLTVTDAKGNVTTFTYDAYGNLASRKDALNNTTAYNYDVLGRLLKVIDAQGNATEYTYDNKGNLLTLKDPLGNITRYTYDKNDELISAADPLGNAVSYAYDCFGNRLSASDALGNAAQFTYDTADQMHLNRAYLLTVKDAKNNATSYTYDSLGRVTRVTDAQGKYYQFAYDNNDNITRRTDAISQAVNYQYDSMDRLTRITYPDLSQANYTYDYLSNITRAQDPSGAYLYTYDKVSRLKAHTYPDATALSYVYDAGGNRASFEISGWGKILYDYDALNRLTKITRPDTKFAQFTYDALSRRAQLVYPNGALSNYAYDAAGRLTQAINKNKAEGEISKFIYTYDASGQRTKVNLLNGVINYTYDKSGQLLQEAGAEAGRNFSASYTYDAAGNRLSMVEDGYLFGYTYNSLNQLTQAQTQKKFIQVKGTASDANSFAVKVNGIAATLSAGQFSANNVPLVPGSNIIRAQATDAAGNVGAHQISVTFNPASANISYAYDASGNLIQRQAGASAETFAYDYENRLKAYAAAGQNASYAYNAQGQRVSKTVNGVTTKYYYDGAELVLEKAGASSIYYLHSGRIDEIISDSQGYCYSYDGLGSVVNITDASGAKVNDYSYKAFGQTRSQSGSLANNWLYTGRQLDPETGLYFYRNRYYDPRAGRFLTRDPAGIIDGLNLYLYCLNSPINHTDPFGLWVAIGERPIGGAGSHTVIILHPDNQGEFINDSRFYRNSKGELEATLSANPNRESNKASPFGNLVATPNVRGDRPGDMRNMQRISDPLHRSDSQLISDILGSAGKYKNNLPYDPTPWSFDPYYNSNSYTYGVLRDAGISNIPNLPGWQPGADKPIPINDK